ncbi:flavoprotein [Undibacterium sp. YM2]|uniref:NAD(P)-binding domain-containing protein n=1 Tax=Undibacterium sp. YM2 TaxID=2058625 RepID=UPI001331F73E|nr:NAD(P)-binding domain-containing protein [Undibacterium sp. YM2]BBB68206.1 flavoprotein [Undibacterium sp. YM2]
MKPQTSALPIAIIGAGPVGLAAAAHLLLRSQQPLILESAASIAANLASYRQVRLFSPWRYNLDQAAVSLLTASGWQQPDPEGLPTAGEMIDHYLQPLAQLPAIAASLHLQHRVIAVSRQSYDKVKTKGREDAAFVLRVATPEGERDYLASAIIDASGTWSQPNPLGANGIPAIGEEQYAAHISYGMPDILGTQRQRFAGKRVLVVGTGHSAAGNLLALAQLAEQVPGTTLLWAIRGNHVAKVFGGGSADGLPARGQLGARLKALKDTGQLSLYRNFRIRQLQSGEHGEDGITVTGDMHLGETPVLSGIDEIIAATGARPDLSLSRELRLRHDPWLESTEALAPLIDPNEHSCGTVRPHGHRELAHPEPGYYAVGAKSYGRAPNFLMATGYEQVRSVVAALSGDLAAADEVQLSLPQTGICSTQPVYELPEKEEPAACCGGAAPAGANACCALDATEKAKGNAGCGCSTQSETPAMPTLSKPAASKPNCCS